MNFLLFFSGQALEAQKNLVGSKLEDTRMQLQNQTLLLDESREMLAEVCVLVWGLGGSTFVF